MKEDKDRIISQKTTWEDYWICDRCDINSDGERMCPCPRGSCEAELVGEVEIVKTISKLEPKLCSCGKLAKWLYMPGFADESTPFVCEDCIQRGCDCNHRYTNEEYPNNPDLTEDGLENVGWKWIKKGKVWVSLDDKGREWPCAEYEFDTEGNNFGSL